MNKTNRAAKLRCGVPYVFKEPAVTRANASTGPSWQMKIVALTTRSSADKEYIAINFHAFYFGSKSRGFYIGLRKVSKLSPQWKRPGRCGSEKPVDFKKEKISLDIFNREIMSQGRFQLMTPRPRF